ncbi:MAG: hypothetical protein ACSHWU_03195 [Marinicella sp.]
MKEAIEEIKSAAKVKMNFWHNIKSRWVKALIVVLFLSLIALKVFTTVLTFDWLSSLF